MKKNTILHVFPDDKFFDSISNFYDSFEGVENRYYLYVSDRNYQYKYIKNSEKVKLFFDIFAYIKELRRKDVDVVIFHRMVGRDFVFANILRKGTKIIWWAWGYDLYSWRSYLPPIIPIELYKPQTKQYVDAESANIQSKISYRIKACVLGKIYSYIRKKAISRVNLFMPCIPIEFDLMRENCAYFHAKLLEAPLPRVENKPLYVTEPKNILVGNSLSYENNHLDVFEYLYRLSLGSDRKFILPVSYGNAYGGSENFIKTTHFKDNSCIWLKDFMPIEDYTALLSTVTHAVFGIIRQQALGNIFACFKTGVKVYLYKDSIPAKQFRRDGYIFYSIEDDLNTESLNECLSKDDAYHNYETYKSAVSRVSRENLQDQIRQLAGKGA